MDPALDRIGRRQHGLLTTPQLLGAGWSYDNIHDAVEANELMVVRRRAVRLVGGRGVRVPPVPSS